MCSLNVVGTKRDAHGERVQVGKGVSYLYLAELFVGSNTRLEQYSDVMRFIYVGILVKQLN